MPDESWNSHTDVEYLYGGYASGFGYVNNGGDGSGFEPSDITGWDTTGWGIGAGSTDTAGTKFFTGNGYGNRFEPCNEINEYP